MPAKKKDKDSFDELFQSIEPLAESTSATWGSGSGDLQSHGRKLNNEQIYRHPTN